MKLSKGVLLIVFVAVVTLSGIAWYLGRGGIHHERLTSDRLETGSQPWAVPEEELEQGPRPPKEQPEVDLPEQ